VTSTEDRNSPSGDETYRQRVYEVRADPDLSLAEKLDRFLSLGCDYIDVENGHIKRIDTERGVHDVIASSGGEAELLQVGAEHAHATTFCRRTIELDSPLAISHAAEEGWAEDPAYLRHGLECYLGATITVEGTTYGTVCFVSQAPHSREFSASERAFVELVAGSVGIEFEAKRQALKLADRDRLNAVLTRVLRHNLRNRMNIVRGSAELLEERLAGEEQELANRIVASADTLIELGETARRLDQIASTAGPPEQQDLGQILSAVTTELRELTADADIDVETPDAQQVIAIEPLEAALYELGENAITHTGDEPTVEIRVVSDSTPDEWVVVEIEDDGPGLPEMERNLLRGTQETQLEHGQGLGLWFVYWTIVRSGGHLTVDVDDGTTIRVWLRPEAAPDDDLQWYLDPPSTNDPIHGTSRSED
jgi:signal transduction histidine kinase